MNHIRSTRGTYVAAFLLGALIALLIVAPARATEPAALDRIGVVRFTAEPDGRLAQQQAILHDDGRLLHQARVVIARPANSQEWVLGRNLIPVEAWQAYRALGYNAVSRFELHDGGARVYFGEQAFLLVAPNFETPFADGRVINLSARLRIDPAAGVDAAVAGFVIEGRPRTVLIRAVGPTLQRLAPHAWLANPFLSLKRNGQTIYFNDNWSAAGEADAIRSAAARVGAFALDENSADAARLVELAPGSYTVVVESATAGAAAGDVLVEIYSVPSGSVE